jgi:hypothetical protein
MVEQASGLQPRYHQLEGTFWALLERRTVVLTAVVPRESHLWLLLREPLGFRDRYRWPLFLLVLAAFFDGLTTYQFLQTLGPQAEFNPFQRLVFTHLPPLAGIVLAKSGQVIAAVLVAAWWQPWCKGLMLLTALIYGLAAVSNHFNWL